MRRTTREDAEVRNGQDQPSPLDVESLVIAHYAVELGLSYDQIHERTGLSRATVARRLQHATEKGYIERQLSLKVPVAMRSRYIERTQDLELQDFLTRRLKDYGLRRAHVVPVDEPQPRGEDVTLKQIGHAAAVRLVEVLARHPDAVVGVNWGWSVYNTIEALFTAAKRIPELVFVPLMGNFALDEDDRLAYNESQMCSANRLARRAAEALNSQEPRRLTTPAIIPGKFADSPEKLDVIWEFIEQDHSYRQIFGVGHHYGRRTRKRSSSAAQPRIDTLDVIITGMSALQQDATLISLAKLVGPRELSILTRAGYVGDLGCHPIHDPGTVVEDPKARDLADKLSNLLIAPNVEDFVRVGKAASESEHQECGVFMVGRGKPRAFLAACRLGAVSELFTDRTTASEMRALLSA